MPGIVGILAKWGAKKISQKLTNNAESGLKFTGIHPVPPPKIPFQDKIRDLATDKGLCSEYVDDLIDQAKSAKSLMPIKKYLESSRNDISYNLTRRLLGRVAKKLEALKKEFAEVDAGDIWEVFF